MMCDLYFQAKRNGKFWVQPLMEVGVEAAVRVVALSDEQEFPSLELMELHHLKRAK